MPNIQKSNELANEFISQGKLGRESSPDEKKDRKLSLTLEDFISRMFEV